MKVEVGILSLGEMRRYVVDCKTEQEGDTLRVKFPKGIRVERSETLILKWTQHEDHQ
jgi:hypothetical protein